MSWIGIIRSRQAADLSVNDVENVTVRIFEPRNFHWTGNMDIAFKLQTRHVVVLKRDTFRLQRADLSRYIVDAPGQSRRLVGSCKLGKVDVNQGISTGEYDHFVVFGSNFLEAERVVVKLPRSLEILNCDRCNGIRLV